MKKDELKAQAIEALSKYEEAADKTGHVLNITQSVVWLTGAGDGDFKDNITDSLPIMFRKLFVTMADPQISAGFAGKMGSSYETFLNLMAEFMEFLSDMQRPTAISQLIRIALDTNNYNPDEDELKEIINTYTGRRTAIEAGYPEYFARR